MQDKPSETPAPERKTMTVPEAAKILGISRNAAYEAANAGQIPIIRLGGRMVVPIPAFERMLEEPPAGA